MRFSDGVNKYHEEKKQSILNSVLNSAQTLPFGEENEKDREGIIMSTNKNNSGAMIKTSKRGIIAAACAILMLGGAAVFYATRGTDTELKTSPGASAVVNADSSTGESKAEKIITGESKTDDSKTEESNTDNSSEALVPAVDDGAYPTTSPATVIAPDDKGTVNEGFEGYSIEVKYLLEDPWKGLENYAQHSYGMVIDVSAKEGYELPWNDEEAQKFSHFGEVWIDNGHSYNMGYFDIIKPDTVVTYGYKTRNENGLDVLRFLIVAEVDDEFEINKDTKVSFNISTVFWGVGEDFKTEGNFTAAETFDKARTIDLSLTIPYQSEK